jgi:predicted GIY-YIG superfamily endonuclease
MWTVYMLRCADRSLYTGITTNLENRLAKHNAGTGAKYTRGRGPVSVVWSKPMKTGTAARKLEAALKKKTKLEKEAMATSSE